MSGRDPAAVSQGQGTRSGVAPRERSGGERRMVPPGEPRSYYGQPVIAEPVWSPEIGWYFFVGGLTGASAPLALTASLRGNRVLARRASATTVAGVAISSVLLIKDLGRPARFFNMLRVFKVSSPMSVGSWVLSAFGATTTLGAARELLGILPRTGRGGQLAAAALGPLLSTYTATLIATTAVPVWTEARRELPFVFAASSLASAGAMACVLTPAAHAGAARRMAVVGTAAELVAVRAMDRRLGWLGEPLHQGQPGTMTRAAKAASVAGGLAVSFGGRHGGPVARAGAGALLVSSLLERFAIFRAGTASARDPKYTVRPQRERAAAREAGGTSSSHALIAHR